MVGGIGFEVVDHVGASHEPSVGPRHTQPGQVRERARRVQMQPVVVVAPGGSNAVGAVDEERVQPVLAQHRADRMPGGTRAEDDDVLGHERS
jgi:hypothetical protein